MFVSCDKNNDNIDSNTVENIELRATTLGFSDTKTYTDSVKIQCLAGNHINCDLLPDGTHIACQYMNHAGQMCNGNYHNGNFNGNSNNRNCCKGNNGIQHCNFNYQNMKDNDHSNNMSGHKH